MPSGKKKRQASLKPSKEDTFDNSIPAPRAKTGEIRRWIRMYFSELPEIIDNATDDKIDKFISSIWWEEDDVWILEETGLRHELCHFGIPMQFRNCLVRRIIKTREAHRQRLCPPLAREDAAPLLSAAVSRPRPSETSTETSSLAGSESPAEVQSSSRETSVPNTPLRSPGPSMVLPAASSAKTLDFNINDNPPSGPLEGVKSVWWTVDTCCRAFYSWVHSVWPIFILFGFLACLGYFAGYAEREGMIVAARIVEGFICTFVFGCFYEQISQLLGALKRNAATSCRAVFGQVSWDSLGFLLLCGGLAYIFWMATSNAWDHRIMPGAGRGWRQVRA